MKGCVQRNPVYDCKDPRLWRGPTSEKLRGNIGFGLSVRPSVILFGSWETQEPLMLES